MAEQRQPRHIGGCQCGATRYAVYAEPTGAGLCHCRMCQKATGNPFHAFTGVAKQDFEWIGDEPGVFASSEGNERCFCRTCGTPMTFASTMGGRITFGIATLDNPDAVASPDRNIGIESKFAWIGEIDDWLSKTTEEDAGADYLAGIVSCQRPDAG